MSDDSNDNSNDDNTLNPTYQQIKDLQKIIQDKLQVTQNEKRQFREALYALDNIAYGSRTVEITAMIPAELDDKGNIITAEIPAVTEQVFDVLPFKTNNPEKLMTQADILDAYNYWNDKINS